jgi:hypothetical protein
MSCVVYYIALLIPSDCDKDYTHLCKNSTLYYVLFLWACPADRGPRTNPACMHQAERSETCLASIVRPAYAESEASTRGL